MHTRLLDVRSLAAGGAIAWLAGAGSLRAQTATGTVEGKVTAGGTTETLTGASVSFAGTQAGAITKGDGTYRVSLRPGTYEMRVRLLGYASRRDTVVVVAGRTVTRNFALTKSAAQLEQVAVTGSRAGERTVVTSPVPVDVLNAAELRSTGRVETAQMIQAQAPSFNFPRPAVADGTDHVRPATLRGLGPDQTLVLINGKRRYTSALVNVNGTVGRGTAAVDINAIPASMIERIEILRDGAAAQYGSDAIAGVINIILKGAGNGSASAQTGQFNTNVPDLGNRTDGGNVTLAADQAVTFGNNSFLHGGIEWRNRAMTNRSFADPRVQYAANDPREATANRLTHWSGDAGTADIVGMYNAGINLANGAQVYSFGSFGRRDGRSTGFFRRPTQIAQVVRSRFPNGFLPNIESDIGDASAAVGIKGDAGKWRYDVSQIVGGNSFQFIVTNSNNASLGDRSPTEFDAGTIGFRQAVTNVDLFRAYAPGGKAVRVATGAELRWENYTISQGDSASWIAGGARATDINGNPTNTLALPGSQVFPGFSPLDVADEGRTAVAAYVDVESDLSRQVLLGAAARFENFSDFGSQATGKLTARFAPTEKFALRGGVATGFRAPSLQQNFFTSTATNFVNGLPVDFRTLPVRSREARLLGARDLKPETSLNLSAGFTVQPTSTFTITADYYNIAINDRIVLSENFQGPAIQTFFRDNGFPAVSGGRYFTNAIDTRTWGLDVVTNYGYDFGSGGFLRLTAGFNQNRTTVTDTVVNTPSQLGALNEVLFGRAEEGRIEEGQPRNNLILSASYDWKKFIFNARTQRFGEVTFRAIRAAPGVRQVPDQTFSAKFITDVSLGYKLFNRAQLTIGSDNVFDVYPDQWNDRGDVATNYGGQGTFGIFRFPGISPFGFNGRYLYARMQYAL
ncbi:MAG: TonB-dependent receptor [Gemmatimonadaceae bacterium]|jgi:iron complex outermembrane receptor protein|nr:TonB-dependent receptor [Gemmatimonadaceae bacterium]